MSSAYATRLKMSEKSLILPYLPSFEYSDIPECRMVYGRLEAVDYQDKCLLFVSSRENCMKKENVFSLRESGFDVCYSYDMFDFENKEFTLDGYREICADIERAVNIGFTHILLANPYTIELVCNEFGGQIKVMISSQLEINSDRGRVFFDVLNDISAVTHLVVSQNQLNRLRLSEIFHVFPDVHIVIEPDRWASDNQIIHEHYYNILYGYHNKPACSALSRLVRDPGTVRFVKPTTELFYDMPGLMYKLGELNIIPELLRQNIAAVREKHPQRASVIDFAMWSEK